MRTFVLYKRKNFLGKQETTFGVDVWIGSKRDLSLKEKEKKEGYVRTIAPGQSPKDLAQIVARAPLEKINVNDLIVSSEATVLIPGSKYMDIPVTPEEVREFYEAYESITSRDV